MWRHIAKRLIIYPMLLWTVYTVTFLMAIVAPGEPFKQSERNIDANLQNALLAQYHADNNWNFYWYYLGNLFNPIDAYKGEGPLVDLGPSWDNRDWNCNTIIAESFPVSAGLGLTSMMIACLIGIPVGVLGAVKRDSIFDHGSLALALIGISLPTFVTGISLLILFAIFWDVLPVGGWGTVKQLILPAITLSLPFTAYIARLTRLGMLDILESDYIRTARAKGLSEQTVIWKHALKNAFLPVLSFLGPATAGIMTGSFVVESIFNIPGIGQHFVNAVLSRDRTLILGTVLVFSTLIIFFNLLVDITYSLIDPRIEVDKA
ncbi:MAG: ABC transporter permease [Phycisphaerae bacterium]|nr:ABC transporter permease [Phycisphaerae bacterium]